MTLNDHMVANVGADRPIKDAVEVYDNAMGRYQDSPMAVRALPPKRPQVCCNPFATLVRR